MTRILRVTRLHLLDPVGTVVTPWAVLSIAFAINLLIFWMLERQGVNSEFTGGLVSAYIVVMVFFIQVMGRLFAFARGLGVSRRVFLLATALFAVGEAAVFGILLYLLRAVEIATSGWGVDLPFFTVGDLIGGNALTQIVDYAGPILLLAGVGMLIGAISTRWGASGLIAAGTLTMIIVGLAVVLLTWWQVWTSIGTWFGDQPIWLLLFGWPTVLAVLATAAAYAVVRRADL